MVLHEIGHFLGFWHEQSRPDRDAHVRINWAEIKTDYEYNFEKAHDARLLAPYDLSSAMHYSLKVRLYDNSMYFRKGSRM